MSCKLVKAPCSTESTSTSKTLIDEKSVKNVVVGMLVLTLASPLVGALGQLAAYRIASLLGLI